MRPITSANLTSPCKLSEPHPSTVMVLPVTVAPAEQAMHLMTLHNHTTKSYISFVDTFTNFCTACVKQWSALIIACKVLQNSTLNRSTCGNTMDMIGTQPMSLIPLHALRQQNRTGVCITYTWLMTRAWQITVLYILYA